MMRRKIISLYLVHALCVPLLIFGTYLFGNGFELSMAMLVEITNQWRWIQLIIGSSVIIYLLSKIPAKSPNNNPQILTSAALYLLVLHFSPGQDSYIRFADGETFVVVVLPLIMILISYKIRALESEKTLPNSTLGGFLRQLNLKLKKAGQPLAKMHTPKNEMADTKNSNKKSDKPLKNLTMGDFVRGLNTELKKAGLPLAKKHIRKKPTDGDTMNSESKSDKPLKYSKMGDMTRELNKRLKKTGLPLAKKRSRRKQTDDSKMEFQVIFHKRGKRPDSTPPGPKPETQK